MKKEEKEKAKEKEQQVLIAELTERYQEAEELRDNLILEDSVIEILNRDFKTIKTALDDKTADDKTEETMTTLEKNLEGYRKQNEQYLTEQRNAIADYHNEMFPQEQQNTWDKLLAEYQDLFDTVKYKAANEKLAEVNAGIMAFLQENTTEAPVEVADNGTQGTAGNGTSGNTSGGNNSSNGGSGNNNAGSGSGNANSDSGTGSGNNSNGGNGNTSNTPSAEQTAPVEEPTQTGDFANGWTYAEAETLATICMAWSDFVYDDAEAQAQLAVQLPGRTCTLVHYPPEQNAEAKALWNSLDRNVYCCSDFYSGDVSGSYFIYGK